MTREEFLREKYREMSEKYANGKRDFYTNPSIARIEPFKIADGLYYVGDKKVCIHLIDTGDGLILLDSGFPGAIHLLTDSIWRAGFDPANVRWIIHSHGHYDHIGASEEFRRMYGTKLAISREDAEKLRSMGNAPLMNEFPLQKIPEFDYEIEDGEIFRLGNTEIHCVLTSGHSEGVLSFFFNVKDGGKTYLAGMYGGAGVNAITLPYIQEKNSPQDAPYQMLASIDKVWDEPVEIHLGNHPYNNRTIEKREKQIKEGGNPFIDSQSWHSFLDDLKDKIKEKIKYNEELEKEIALL